MNWNSAAVRGTAGTALWGSAVQGTVGTALRGAAEQSIVAWRTVAAALLLLRHNLEPPREVLI